MMSTQKILIMRQGPLIVITDLMMDQGPAWDFNFQLQSDRMSTVHTKNMRQTEYLPTNSQQSVLLFWSYLIQWQKKM